MINQFEMFNRISDYGFLKRVDSGCCSLFSNGLTWPDMAIQTPGLVYKTSELDIYLKCPNQASTLMLIKETLNEHDLRLLADAFYRPVGEWVNMFYNLKSVELDEKIELTICQLDSSDDSYLKMWCRVVSEQLFRGKQLDIDLFKALVAKDEFKLYAGICNGVVISTSLTFQGSDKGIYMVATDKVYQRRGFGKKIVSKILSDCYLEGLDAVYLQSTVAGIKLYQTMGFAENSRSILFYKIGK